MVACSSGGSSWISSDGTSIYIDGEPVMLTEFNGVTGSYIGEGISASYKICAPSIRDCLENRENVREDDQDSYKKSKYFKSFLDSQICMHIPLEKGVSSKEAVATTEDSLSKPLDSIMDSLYKTLNNIKFESITTSVFDGSVEVRSSSIGIIVRNTDITIPGILTVGKGTKDCTQQVNIGDITCMKYESNNYDFYQYGDNLIKAAKGTPIEEYITLLPLE